MKTLLFKTNNCILLENHFHLHRESSRLVVVAFLVVGMVVSEIQAVVASNLVVAAWALVAYCLRNLVDNLRYFAMVVVASFEVVEANQQKEVRGAVNSALAVMVVVVLRERAIVMVVEPEVVAASCLALTVVEVVPLKVVASFVPLAFASLMVQEHQQTIDADDQHVTMDFGQPINVLLLIHAVHLWNLS